MVSVSTCDHVDHVTREYSATQASGGDLGEGVVEVEVVLMWRTRGMILFLYPQFSGTSSSKTAHDYVSCGGCVTWT